MDKPIYLLVADRGKARIFSTDSKMQVLDVVLDEENPAGRKIRAETESDRPGRTSNSTGHLHALGNEYSSERHEDERFAKYLCHILVKEHGEKKFRELMIAAPPHFLGELRQSLDPECQKALSATIDKDLLRASDAEIGAHFRARKQHLASMRTTP